MGKNVVARELRCAAHWGAVLRTYTPLSGDRDGRLSYVPLASWLQSPHQCSAQPVGPPGSNAKLFLSIPFPPAQWATLTAARWMTHHPPKEKNWSPCISAIGRGRTLFTVSPTFPRGADEGVANLSAYGPRIYPRAPRGGAGGCSLKPWLFFFFFGFSICAFQISGRRRQRGGRD